MFLYLIFWNSNTVVDPAASWWRPLLKLDFCSSLSFSSFNYVNIGVFSPCISTAPNRQVLICHCDSVLSHSFVNETTIGDPNFEKNKFKFVRSYIKAICFVEHSLRREERFI